MPLKASLYFPLRNFFEGVYGKKTPTPVPDPRGPRLSTRPSPLVTNRQQSAGAVERVVRVHRPAVRPYSFAEAAHLFTLNVTVMVWSAEAFEVVRVSEERPIATVGLDVVDHGGGGGLALFETALAQRLLGQLLRPQPLVPDRELVPAVIGGAGLIRHQPPFPP